MRRSSYITLAIVPVALFVVLMACRPTVCAPGETQECYCPGSVTSAQVCGDDGTSWDSCPCPGDDDDSGPAADDDDVAPNDDDVAPDDDDVAPDDDDVAPDDDDVAPDDDDVAPDDDDATQVQLGTPADCSSGPEVCEDPANCPFALGCTCVDMDDFQICLPLCNTQDDCPWKDGEQLACGPEGFCAL